MNQVVKISQNLKFQKFSGGNPSSRVVVLFHGMVWGDAALIWETEWVNSLIAQNVSVLKIQNPYPFPRDLREVAAASVAFILSEYPNSTLTFVGHSLGGMIAMEAAAMMMKKEEGNLACVVLVASAGKQNGKFKDVCARALEILDEMVPHEAHRTLDRLVTWGRTQPTLQQFMSSPMVKNIIREKHDTSKILFQIRAALAWMVETRPVLAEISRHFPKFTIISAGLDSILPAKENSQTIMDWLASHGVPKNRQEFILLESSDHSMADVFTGKDGAEYVLRCGDLALTSKLRIGMRMFRNNHRIVAWIILAIILAGLLFVVFSKILKATRSRK